VRRAFLALATRVIFQTAGAVCRDQLRGDSGEVGTYAVGYRSSSLHRHLTKASRLKSTAVIDAHEVNAAADRFRDFLFVVFSRANLVNTLPGLMLADMTFMVPFALVMLCAYMQEFSMSWSKQRWWKEQPNGGRCGSFASPSA
jgi:hypothetical protein